MIDFNDRRPKTDGELIEELVLDIAIIKAKLEHTDQLLAALVKQMEALDRKTYQIVGPIDLYRDGRDI